MKAAFIFMLILSGQASAEALCQKWTSRPSGTLDQILINEASGLGRSQIQNDKYIWSNDSGSRARLYATGIDGKIERMVQLKGFINIDFEAISLGPCPRQASESCIYVGDIGDQLGLRWNFKIGVFKEAEFWSRTSISPEKVYKYSYPNGREDAEAMVALPDGKMLIFSKDSTGLSQVYELNRDGDISRLTVLDLTKILNGPGKITDASLSPDKETVLLSTYTDIIELKTELILKNRPFKEWKLGIDYNVITGPGLPQQETISYRENSNSFIISSESAYSRNSQIVQYSCHIVD